MASTPPPATEPESSQLSVVGVTIEGMDVSTDLVGKVPATNLRVSRAQFGALWATAETQLEHVERGPEADFTLGIVLTCRWLSRQPYWLEHFKQWEVPRTPLFGRELMAMPETIEVEYLAAARAQVRFRGRPSGTAERARGIVATLDWTWRGSGQPPLEIPPAAVAS